MIVPAVVTNAAGAVFLVPLSPLSHLWLGAVSAWCRGGGTADRCLLPDRLAVLAGYLWSAAALFRPRLRGRDCAGPLFQRSCGGAVLRRSSPWQNNLTLPRHHRPDRTLSRRRLPLWQWDRGFNTCSSSRFGLGRPAGGTWSGPYRRLAARDPRPARRLDRRAIVCHQRSGLPLRRHFPRAPGCPLFGR